MEVTQMTPRIAPCNSPLPELEVPMINAMAACLECEHHRMGDRILQLALAATRLAGERETSTAGHSALEIWDDIRSDLRSHLQIEEELIFSWGAEHHAISPNLLHSLKIERQEMHYLVASLHDSLDDHHQPPTATARDALAQTLLSIARKLDMHIERYETEVLPSIRRMLFQK